jgi:hypothetical protein
MPSTRWFVIAGKVCQDPSPVPPFSKDRRHALEKAPAHLRHAIDFAAIGERDSEALYRAIAKPDTVLSDSHQKRPLLALSGHYASSTSPAGLVGRDRISSVPAW